MFNDSTDTNSAPYSSSNDHETLRLSTTDSSEEINNNNQQQSNQTTNINKNNPTSGRYLTRSKKAVRFI